MKVKHPKPLEIAPVKIITQVCCEELGGQPAYKMLWNGRQRVCLVTVPVTSQDTVDQKKWKCIYAEEHARKLVSVHRP